MHVMWILHLGAFSFFETNIRSVQNYQNEYKMKLLTVYMVLVCGWDVFYRYQWILVCVHQGVVTPTQSAYWYIYETCTQWVSHCPGITQLHCMSTPSVTHISYNVEIVDRLVTIVYWLHNVATNLKIFVEIIASFDLCHLLVLHETDFVERQGRGASLVLWLVLVHDTVCDFFLFFVRLSSFYSMSVCLIFWTCSSVPIFFTLA